MVPVDELPFDRQAERADQQLQQAFGLLVDSEGAAESQSGKADDPLSAGFDEGNDEAVSERQRGVVFAWRK
jgi:hypothetical protein